MTITISLPWLLLLGAIVLAIIPALRGERGDWDFGGVIWVAACWPTALVLLVWAIVEFIR